MATRLILFVICSAVAFRSCQLPGQDLVAPRILDGTNTSVSSFPNVARIIINKSTGTFLGSGVLIAPQYVLTAAHLVTNSSAAADVQSGSSVTLNNATFTIDKVFVNPTFTDTNGLVEGQFDSALLHLTESTASIAPFPIYRAVPVPGMNLTIVGYGEEGTGTTGENNVFPPAGTVNYGSTQIDSVTATFVQWTYQQGRSTAGNGDSGGPGLLAGNGTQYIVSIDNGTPQNNNDGWGTVEYEMRVDAAANWMDSIIGFTDLFAVPVQDPPLQNTFGAHPFSVSSTVVNNGNNAAPAFSVTYRLSANSVYHDSDPLLGEVRLAGGLGAHSSTAATWSGPLPNISGTFTIVWKVDSHAEVFQSDTFNDTGFDPNPIKIVPNAAPVFSSAPSDMEPVLAGIPAAFNASVTDPNGDAVTLLWDFGDGSSSTDSSPEHTFAAAGTYTVKVTASDGFGGNTSAVLTVNVFPLSTANANSAKFALNFKTSGHDGLDFTLQGGQDFTFADRVSAAAAMNGHVMNVFVGPAQIDTVMFSNGKGRGSNGGALSCSFKTGSVHYSARHANLQSAFAPYGATNSTGAATVSLPLLIEFNGHFYGGTHSFSYSATAGKSGTGK